MGSTWSAAAEMLCGTATEREELLEHVTTDEDWKAPWTIPRIVDQLGSHEYEDLTEQSPSQYDTGGKGLWT